MTKAFLTGAALAALGAAVAAEGELVRSDFAFDGVAGLVGWEPVQSLGGGMSATVLDEKGPTRRPVVRLAGSAKEVEWNSAEIKVVPGEPYRVSIHVRTSGLGEKSARIELAGAGTRMRVYLPADTKGEWRKVEKTLTYPPKDKAKTAWRFSLRDFAGGATLDISAPALEPLSEKARAGSSAGKSVRIIYRVVPVDPLLSEVDAESASIRFRVNAANTDGCEIVASCDGGRESAADPQGRVQLGAIGAGRHEVKVRLVEKATGKTRIENRYNIIAKPSGGRTVRPVGRRLNNFATELTRTELKDGEFAFEVPRRGWVWLCFEDANDEAVGWLDGNRVVAKREGEPLESLRELAPGRHVLAVKGATRGRLRINLVKPTFTAGLGIFPKKNQFRTKYRDFGWDFYRKAILPSISEFGARFIDPSVRDVYHPGSKEPAFLEFMREMRDERGKSVVESIDFGVGEREMRFDYERVHKRLCLGSWWKAGLPLVIDENGLHSGAKEINYCGEHYWEMANLLDPRPIHMCWFSVQTKPLENWNAILATVAANVNSGLGTGCIVSETYLSARADKMAVTRQIENLKANQRILAEMMPAAGRRLAHLLCGHNMLGVWTKHLVPQVDEKVLMDELVHQLATDPDFADVGGVGFSTPHCGEELYRWGAKIIHHYAIEGNTACLSEKLGWRYFPGTVANGDFVEGLKGWTARGDVTAGMRENFGRNVQKRNCAAHEEGDFFAVMTRSATHENTLSQRIGNLVPGRRYALSFATSDYDQVENPDGATEADFDVRVEVKGAAFDENLTSRIVCGGRKGSAQVVNWRYVFAAPATEAELVFGDWKSPDVPGGKAGRRLVLNYISVNPYYEDECGALK